jgi:hypothetical protein
LSIGYIKASTLMREKRWDVSFHLALERLKARVDELRDLMDADAAVGMLAGVALADKKPLSALMRGVKTVNSQTVAEIEREYPHLSLALVEESLREAVDRIRAEIERSETTLEMLLDIGRLPRDREMAS